MRHLPHAPPPAPRPPRPQPHQAAPSASPHIRRLLPLLALAILSHGLAATILVQPGDTLAALARRYDTTVSALQNANGLTSTDLRAGQALTLPTATDSTTTYTVRAGDTLYDIAYATRTSVDALMRINRLDGTLIRPGQILQLDAARDPATPTPPTTLTIRPGDNLWTIARDHDTTIAALATTNNLDPQAILTPGTTLRLPAAADTRAQGGPALHQLTVSPGDSLWTLAQTHGTTVGALITLNRLTTTTIKPGQTLAVAADPDLGEATTRNLADAVPKLQWPLRGRLTSPFGYRQLAITNKTFHTGIDIAGTSGDPIRAAIAGTVSYSGERGDYGLQIAIRTGPLETRYSHASRLLVQAGQTVEAGQVIALVGSTGLSTGPHLDFEVRLNGVPLDPLPILQRPDR